ncbi:hypothetical protein BsWGS_25439 [Bradybaena similaris]
MNSLLLLTILVALVPPFFCLRCRTCGEEFAALPCLDVDPAKCKGKVSKMSGMCGDCCAICYRTIAPGEKCHGSPWYLYNHVECSEGYSCDIYNTNTCRQIEK